MLKSKGIFYCPFCRNKCVIFEGQEIECSMCHTKSIEFIEDVK